MFNHEVFCNFNCATLIKCVPLSLMRTRGKPKHVTMFSYINLATNSLVHDTTGFVSTHFITYSTVVMMYFSPVHFSLLGNRSKNSTPHISNGRDGIMECNDI